MALNEIYDVLTSFLNFLESEKKTIPKSLQNAIVVVRKYHTNPIIEEKQKKEVVGAMALLIKNLEEYKKELHATTETGTPYNYVDTYVDAPDLRHYINILETLFNQYTSMDDETVKKIHDVHEYAKARKTTSDENDGAEAIKLFGDYLVGNYAIKEAYELLREKLKGKTLCDLGCGSYNFIQMSTRFRIPPDLQIKQYIGVDKYRVATSENNFINVSKYNYGVITSELNPGDIGLWIKFVRMDMLEFVSKMPDNSMNYLICNINNSLIFDHEYFERLNKELLRTTEKNGIITGCLVEKEILKDFKILFPKNDDPSEHEFNFFVATKE